MYTSGFVRQVVRRKIAYKGPTVDAQIIETQSPTNPGDSGGPVISDDGEMVGVVSGANLNARQQTYFIDITEVHAVVAQLAPK